MTVGQNFRHWSSMSAQAMLIIPSPTVTKLGIASTFILGAAIGNKVKKLWKEQPHHGTSEERRNYLTTTAKLSENITTPKECDTVNRLLSILQNVSINLPDQNHATKYYIDKASILCTNYLCSRGVRELSVDDILGNWIEDSDWIDNTDHWLKLPSLRQYERPSYSSALLAGVKALWHLSRFENFCLEGSFSDKGLLNTLHKILEEDSEAAPFILRILANILPFQRNLQIFHDTGLIEEMKSYSESSHPELFLPAWRGLCNLKQYSERSFHKEIYVEGVYPFILPCLDKTESPVLDIVLVHGVKGRASWTWRQHDQQKFKPALTQEERRKILTKKHNKDIDALYTYCWPLDWLVASLDIPVRIIAVEYDADWQISNHKCPLEACGKKISEHAEILSKSLKLANVGSRPIIWISHSMGGLIVKHILMDDCKEDITHIQCLKASLQKEQFVYEKGDLPKKLNLLQDDQRCGKNLTEQTKGVVFFSVPHHGTPLASFVSKPVVEQLLNPSVEVCEMSEDSPVLKETQAFFSNMVNTHGTSVLTLNESRPIHHDFLGLNIYFVPSKNADPKVGKFYEVDASHLDICKPMSRESDIYKKVSEFVQEVIKNL